MTSTTRPQGRKSISTSPTTVRCVTRSSVPRPGLNLAEKTVDDTRERRVGDNFIVNFGSEARPKQDPSCHHPQSKSSFHSDND